MNWWPVLYILYMLAVGSLYFLALVAVLWAPVTILGGWLAILYLWIERRVSSWS